MHISETTLKSARGELGIREWPQRVHTCYNTLKERYTQVGLAWCFRQAAVLEVMGVGRCLGAGAGLQVRGTLPQRTCVLAFLTHFQQSLTVQAVA